MFSTPSPVTALTQIHIETRWPSTAMARVAVVGEVDLATADLLRDRLLAVLREEARAVLEVDLDGVTFLDCAGVRALAMVHNAAVRTGRQLRVTHPQPIVRRVLEATGVLGILTAPTGQPPPPGSGQRSMVEQAPATATRPIAVPAAA